MPIELETVASRPFMRHGSPIEACRRSAEDRRVLGARVGADQHQVLVAAEVGDAVFGPGEALQARGDLAQHEVAGGVAERFVDRLEAVEIDEQDRQPLVRRCRACCTAWASMPSNIRRFGSPVRPSRKLRRSSSLSARRSERRRRASSTENSRPTTQDRARADRSEQDQRRRRQAVDVERARSARRGRRRRARAAGSRPG